MNDERVRVLVADDHAMFREGLRSLLVQDADFEIVGEVATGREAVRMATQLLPDLVLMDLQMPDLHGIDATREITRVNPHIRVLILTMFDDDTSIFSAMQAGAIGYILKGAKSPEVLRAVKSVAAGEAIFSPAIALRLSQYFSRIPVLAQPELIPSLTARENEVLALIASGHPNAYIAKHLEIRPKTLRNHITNILSKLQVADRAEAILRSKGVAFVSKSKMDPG